MQHLDVKRPRYRVRSLINSEIREICSLLERARIVPIHCTRCVRKVTSGAQNFFAHTASDN